MFQARRWKVVCVVALLIVGRAGAEMDMDDMVRVMAPCIVAEPAEKHLHGLMTGRQLLEAPPTLFPGYFLDMLTQLNTIALRKRIVSQTEWFTGHISLHAHSCTAPSPRFRHRTTAKRQRPPVLLM